MTTAPDRIPRIMRKLEALWRAQPSRTLFRIIPCCDDDAAVEASIDRQLSALGVRVEESANGRWIDNRLTRPISTLCPGMRVVFRGPGWDDVRYGPASEMTVPGRESKLFWDGECPKIVMQYWHELMKTGDVPHWCRGYSCAKCYPPGADPATCGCSVRRPRAECSKSKAFEVCRCDCHNLTVDEVIAASAEPATANRQEAAAKCGTCQGIRIVPIYDPRGYTGGWKSCPACGGTGWAKP